MTSFRPPPQSKLVPGFKLDRYELLCPIAEGGMATVWLGRLVGAHGFAKLVAIKAILPKYAADPAFQKMFLDEARVASYIEHPNVGHIFDLGERDGTLYLVMEWLDSDSLFKVYRAVASRGLEIPPGIVLRIMADTCAGLHAAHELCDRDGISLGLVHRDISPQNILVTTDGVAKLIDFGIAKAKNRLTHDTNEGVVKGKLQYMAPEQAAGKPVDRRADIWSIGAVLYRLLGGKPPYDASDAIAAIQLLTSGQPPPPLPDTVHPAIRAVVDRALSFNVDDRFATAAGFQVAIEDAMLEGEFVTSSATVRRFLAKHLKDRATARRNAIEVALQAAAKREELESILKPATPKSGGTIQVHAAPETWISETLPNSPDNVDTDAATTQPQRDFTPTLKPKPVRGIDVARYASFAAIPFLVAGLTLLRFHKVEASPLSTATDEAPHAEPTRSTYTPASAPIEPPLPTTFVAPPVASPVPASNEAPPAPKVDPTASPKKPSLSRPTAEPRPAPPSARTASLAAKVPKPEENDDGF